LRDTFLNALQEGLDVYTKQAVESYYRTSANSLLIEWGKLNKLGLDLMVTFKSSATGKNYVDYTPAFGTTQKRIVDFSEDPTASNDLKKQLQDIYANKNNSSNINPYNFKSKFK
jgi:predicted DNA-binding WGR domain protein